jgi:hypothetical protein
LEMGSCHLPDTCYPSVLHCQIRLLQIGQVSYFKVISKNGWNETSIKS